MVLYIVLLVIVASAAASPVTEDGNFQCDNNKQHCFKGDNLGKQKWNSRFHPTLGDPQFCLQQNKNLLRMEVLPGIGWDNLRNVGMGMVTFRNYSQCLTTEDGKYLVPDNTFAIAIKESSVVLNSEYFDHWNNYSSMTSNSINTEVNAGPFSGKFSAEFESVKKHQVENKAVTTRVQLRYKYYTMKVQPGAQLHPGFKFRLMDIAAHLQSNNTEMARYMADLVVRDYGTHYVTSIDAGAVLAKIDHIKKSYAADFSEDKSKITSSASASFGKTFGFSVSGSHESDKTSSDSYSKNSSHSQIHTIGGPPFRSSFSIDQWENRLPNNLVAVDRAGDPLNFAITPEVFPELTDSLLIQLDEVISKSVKQYYQHNSRKGCTDSSSPNFDFQAILDDSSCEQSLNNFAFGGVYQTCQFTDSTENGDHCSSFRQKNPKAAAAYSCPENYQAVLLHKGTAPTVCHRVCYWSWFFKHCHNVCGQAEYQTYWCVNSGQVDDNSGFMFGGIYNKIKVNPLTGSKSCPPHFQAQHFGPDGMFICISDDFELGSTYSVPFAGFFSCSAGNPLASKNPNNNNDPSTFSKQCPPGSSQHLALIDNDCEIMYCIKANALSGQVLAPVHRPPFRHPPKMNYNITVPLTIVNDDIAKVWMKEPNDNWVEATEGVVLKHLSETDITKGAIANLKDSKKRIDGKVMKYLAEIVMNKTAIDSLNGAAGILTPSSEKIQSAEQREDNSPISTGGGAAIAIGVLALIVIVLAVVIQRYRKKKNAGFVMKQSPMSYDNIETSN